MNCKKVGELLGGKWDKILECNKRVYSTETISPTLRTCSGGNEQVKILEEPIIYDDFNSRIKADQNTITTLTTNCGNAALQNGVKIIESNYKVRTLTEKECFKLMSVKKDDFEKIKQNQSKSSLYHLAGDSIVVAVIMALFGEMTNIDYKNKIEQTVKEILE